LISGAFQFSPCTGGRLRRQPPWGPRGLPGLHTAAAPQYCVKVDVAIQNKASYSQ